MATAAPPVAKLCQLRLSVVCTAPPNPPHRAANPNPASCTPPRAPPLPGPAVPPNHPPAPLEVPSPHRAARTRLSRSPDSSTTAADAHAAACRNSCASASHVQRPWPQPQRPSPARTRIESAKQPRGKSQLIYVVAGQAVCCLQGKGRDGACRKRHERCGPTVAVRKRAARHGRQRGGPARDARCRGKRAPMSSLYASAPRGKRNQLQRPAHAAGAAACRVASEQRARQKHGRGGKCLGVCSPPWDAWGGGGGAAKCSGRNGRRGGGVPNKESVRPWRPEVTALRT